MTDHSEDLFELLRRADPAPLEDMPGPDSDFGHRVGEAAKLQPSIRPHRRRRVLTVAVAAAALVGAAATYYFTRPATEPSVVVCYEASTLDATRVAVAAPPALTTAACEPLWRDGTLVSTVVQGEVPPLVGCVNDTGALWVFPSDDASLCNDLGLTNHEPTRTPDDSTALMGLLVDMFDTEECLSIADTQQRIAQLLDTHDLTAWRVAIASTPSDERPCASFSLDAPTKTIRLVPIPTPSRNGD